MAMNPYGSGRRGQRGGGGGGGAPHNPFEMMNSQMNAMMSQMDSAFGGGFGQMGSMMGGGMGSMMGGGGSMRGGGGGGGSSYSCSSCCYSSSSSSNGGQPHTVQYSSSSHGMQRPGEEMVSETHRNYRDSTGQEKLGVSRRIGDRGRSVTAERGADGREERRDNLFNVEDGSSFDREWRGNNTATAINQARTQQRQQTQMLGHDGGFGGGFGGGHSLLGGPAGGMLGGGMLGYHGREPQPEVSASDRRAALEGARRHEEQRNRMIAEARRERDGGDGGRSAQRGSAGRSAHGQSDAAYASRLAQQEARRAGMY